MKYKKSEVLSDEPSMLRNLLLTCISEDNNSKVVINDVSKKDEIDIVLTVNGHELDLFKFAEKIDKSLNDMIKRKAELLTNEMIDEIVDKSAEVVLQKKTQIISAIEKMNEVMNELNNIIS